MRPDDAVGLPEAGVLDASAMTMVVLKMQWRKRRGMFARNAFDGASGKNYQYFFGEQALLPPGDSGGRQPLRDAL